MNDFEKYCKNRIKYAFFRFIFFLLFAILVFFLSSKLHLFSDKVYALETTTIYGTNTNGTLGNSGYFNYWKQAGGLYATTLNTVNSDTSWGMYFYINKASSVGKVYKIRLNFNDYDFLKTVNASYIRVIGFNGSTNVGNCNILSFNLLNQGGQANQAKGVEFTYNCLEPSSYKYIGIIKYDDNDNRLRTTTIDWRLNNVQWEEVEDTQAQQIIINASQNTQNIINNQNTNTQNIIDNQNSIAEQQHEDQLSCETIDKNNIVKDNYFIYYEYGSERSDIAYGITDYIKLDNKSILKVLSGYSNQSIGYCFYTTAKDIIGCYQISTLTVGQNITIPSNADYFRTTIRKNVNQPSYQLCKNGNQAITDSIGDLTDTLTDDSPVNMDSLGNTAGWLPPGPIDSIINLPLSFFNSLLTALNGTCSPLNVPIPFLTDTIQIPCISTLYGKINGFSTFWTWVGSITSVVILYQYLLALYKYYDDLTTLKANFIDDFGGAP